MKPARGSFVTGLVVGLLIGLSVALGVALYITKAPVPFINKVPQRSAEQDAAEAERNKHWDPNAPLAGKNPARPAAGAVAPAASAAPAPVAAMAPGGGVASATAATSAPPRPAAPAATAGANPPAGPPNSPAARQPRDPSTILAGQPDPAAGGTTTAAKADAKPAIAAVPSFFVQAGAYARSEDAESQRAKLALLDLTARITEREQSGRTVFRVRLGPFETRSDAEDAQVKLAAAGIDANLVRVER